jgi:hypothetical protein
MTQDIRETLKLALEALLHAYHEDEAHPRTLEAITAIKEALAQEQEPVIDKSAAIRIATSLGWSPQRTWVGLTDEEIAQGCKESWVTEQAWQSAVWWAEDKLKERNT